MSFKDDFLEAWRSVKRDFFRDTEFTEPEPTTTQKNVQHIAEPQQPWTPPPVPEQPVFVLQEDEFPKTTPAYTDPPATSARDDQEIYKAFRQASARPEDDYSASYDEEYLGDETDTAYADATPYRDYNPEPPKEDGRRAYDQFEGSSVFADDKTIISKNTIIRGALSTEDSVRLLGQIMGDIDCKSNIVVAGKVRGNTSAANAYLFDAQVDGDVRCDDIINISNDAWVLGNIRAQQAEIDGKIKGNIEIRHMVSIGPSSSVLGDISADELEIKRGAFINGQIMMYSPSRDVLDRFDQFDDK